MQKEKKNTNIIRQQDERNIPFEISGLHFQAKVGIFETQIQFKPFFKLRVSFG